MLSTGCCTSGDGNNFCGDGVKWNGSSAGMGEVEMKLDGDGRRGVIKVKSADTRGMDVISAQGLQASRYGVVT